MAKTQEPSFRFRNCLIGIRCLLGRFRHGSSVLSVVMLTGLLVSPVAAQTIGDVPGFWGLRQGNEITVLVASSRRTDIAVDGQPEVTRETSESLQIRYRVVAIERSGDVVVNAIVKKLDRQPASSSLARLNGMTFSLVIHPDGNVNTLNPEDPDALVAHLSNGDPESAQVLKKCLSHESIASWFSVPFWMIRPAEDHKKQDAWERSHDVSLGTLGSLKLDLNLRLGDIQDSMVEVVIASDARFRPLVLPDTAVASFPSLSNARVEIDEVQGTGRIYVASQDADEPPGARPEFESVEWTLRLHGEAQLPLEKSAKTAAVRSPDNDSTTEQDAPLRTGAVTFRQTQHQIWTLQSFSIGTHRVLEYDRQTRPIQQFVPVPPQ